MKDLLKSFLVTFVFMLTLGFLVSIGLPAWAQDVVVTPPTDSDYLNLIHSLGGLKGAGGLVIAAFVVQVLMLLAKSALGEIAGKYQLLLVLGLSLVSGIVTLHTVQGMDWGAALIHSSTLAAAQVFLHQLWTQFSEKPAPPAV